MSNACLKGCAIRHSASTHVKVSRRPTKVYERGKWENERGMVVERRGERESEGKSKALVGSKTVEEKEINRVKYKIVKKAAKKTVAVGKNNAYERLYQRLNSKKGQNEIFKLVKVREILTRDFYSMKCIKDEDGELLVEDTKVQERWQNYFYKLFNEERFHVSQNNEHLAQEGQQNSRPCRLISNEEAKKVLRKMKVEKAISPDSIPVKI